MPESPSPPNFSAQALMLENRLRKVAAHRRKWARREGVSCYRLYDRDIPEVPLIIDWYAGQVHVAERARPNLDALDDAAHQAWIQAMSGAISLALGVTAGDTHFKRRARQKGAAQYEALGQGGERREVAEGAARLLINLTDYLDTGLFLDHRPLRLRVGAEARDQRVLNLFCYTGAFTVHAALGGAWATTSVDLSGTYLEWASENLRLNALDPKKHRLVRADVMAFLRDPAERDERYDLMVVDPPTFSNSARMEGVFDVQRDHVELLSRLTGMLSREGRIYFSTNFRRFKFEAEALPGLEAREITEETLGPDFRDARIHRCWRLTRRP